MLEIQLKEKASVVAAGSLLKILSSGLSKDNKLPFNCQQ